mgnify:CR=1 FL=1
MLHYWCEIHLFGLFCWLFVFFASFWCNFPFFGAFLLLFCVIFPSILTIFASFCFFFCFFSRHFSPFSHYGHVQRIIMLVKATTPRQFCTLTAPSRSIPTMALRGHCLATSTCRWGTQMRQLTRTGELSVRFTFVFVLFYVEFVVIVCHFRWFYIWVWYFYVCFCLILSHF